MAFQNYPQLTDKEFAEACRSLQRLYQRVTCDLVSGICELTLITTPENKRWLNCQSSTYIAIKRSLGWHTEEDNAGLDDEALAAEREDQVRHFDLSLYSSSFAIHDVHHSIYCHRRLS